MSEGVEFFEPDYREEAHLERPRKPMANVVKFMLKKEVVKTEEDGNAIVVIITIVAFTLSFVLFYIAMWYSSNQTPL